MQVRHTSRSASMVLAMWGMWRPYAAERSQRTSDKTPPPPTEAADSRLSWAGPGHASCRQQVPPHPAANRQCQHLTCPVRAEQPGALTEAGGSRTEAPGSSLSRAEPVLPVLRGRPALGTLCCGLLPLCTLGWACALGALWLPPGVAGSGSRGILSRAAQAGRAATEEASVASAASSEAWPGCGLMKGGASSRTAFRRLPAAAHGMSTCPWMMVPCR